MDSKNLESIYKGTMFIKNKIFNYIYLSCVMFCNKLYFYSILFVIQDTAEAVIIKDGDVRFNLKQ